MDKITIFYEGPFIMQDIYRGEASLLSVASLSELTQIYESLNSYTILGKIWNYLPEDITKLIYHGIIQVSFETFQTSIPYVSFHYHIEASLSPEHFERFDFEYAKAIEPLNYETREKMVKSIVFELGQAVLKWEYDVIHDYETAGIIRR